MERTSRTRSPLAGRVQECRRLREILTTSADGCPGVVLVHGEPGVGKTRLLREITDRAADEGNHVLWGGCLRLAATSAPYLPLVAALESWLTDPRAGQEPRKRVAERLAAQAPGLARLVPRLADLDGARERPLVQPCQSPTGTVPEARSVSGPAVGAAADLGTGGLLVAWDTALSALCADAPTILVVDDLHWSDLTSLDVLTYLASGPGRRPLTVLTTHRDTELPDGHPLHGWLADLRRLPTVHDLPLRALTLDETEQQVALLLGGDPRPELAAEVHDRSHGNAYLTELLTEGVDPAASALPPGLPEKLRSALLASWHRLPATARDTVLLLAVAGRPTTIGHLGRVAARAARAGSVDVRAALREAVSAGIVVIDPSGRAWFRHPLLAEVLDGVLAPEERTALHAAFADTYDADERAGVDEPVLDARGLADRATHCEHAGRFDEAFEYNQRAADEAARVQAFREEATLRCRAADLWDRTSPRVRDRYGTETDLLTAAAYVARWAGDEPRALRLLDRARHLVDPARDPLTAARTLTLWTEAAYTSGLFEALPVEEFARIVDLTAAYPHSPEHAHALADLADCESWRGMTQQAREHADLAVAAAHGSGDPAETSFALKARTMAFLGEDSAMHDAEASVAYAERSGRTEYIALACVAHVTALDDRGRFEECARVCLRGFTAARQVGFGGLTAYLAVYAAQYLLACGDLGRADQLLRELLATRPGGIAGAQAHVQAALVALRQDRLPRAERHLAAARDLMPRLEHRSGLHASSVVAEYLVAGGHPDDALRVLGDTIEAHAPAESQYADLLLTWGARAAADWAAGLSSEGAAVQVEARQVLDQLTAARARHGVPFAREEADPVDAAWHALYEAEVGRLTDAPDAPVRWAAAVKQAMVANLRHVAAESLLRLAESLVRADRPRADVAEPLRQAHRMATRQGAEALRREAEAFARMTRIDLSDPAPTADGGQSAAIARLLTPRELEVVRHLIAGRSYAEIARELFISQKTVGVHVSNVLRKTGTANRAAAAVWARNQGLAGPTPPSPEP